MGKLLVGNPWMLAGWMFKITHMQDIAGIGHSCELNKEGSSIQHTA